MTVPTSSLIAMGAAAAFCALLPIGILIWWRRTERVRLLPALWGALAFLLFARGLEMGLHYLCILSDNAVSRAILSSPWLYMLYGALTAGIFEECGRFCMYKTVMRRYDGRAAAVTAGIGHGGIEAMTVSAASMALYLVFALCWNAGDTDALLKLAGSAETAQTVAASLGKYTVGYCLLACLERVSAMLLHISLSVLCLPRRGAAQSAAISPSPSACTRFSICPPRSTSSAMSSSFSRSSCGLPSVRSMRCAAPANAILRNVTHKGGKNMEPIKLGRYRHFKGNEYEVVGLAKHSETLEDMVVYRALYGEFGLWVRPAAMWNETVERDGKTYRRFTYLGE